MAMNKNPFENSYFPHPFVLATLLVFAVSCCFCSSIEDEVVVLTGSTIIDTSGLGKDGSDIRNAVIVIKNGVITAVDGSGSVFVPEGARIIDITGKYVVPGLIDGFAAINNQSYANAYLYSGVTSIIGVSSARRGGMFTDGDPSPNIYPLESVGDSPQPADSLIAQIEKLAEDGCKVVLLMYQVLPEQIDTLVDRAHELGMVTIGELGRTSYKTGMEAGVDAFVHSTRYTLNAADSLLQRKVADNPFSDELDSYKWQYYSWLSTVSPKYRPLQEHVRTIAEGGTAIMPTLSLLYLDQEWSRNPWLEPAAAIIDANDINNPADRKTGKHDYDPEHAAAYAALARNLIRIEREYYRACAKYLAGSATDVWGTMPGISLHQELESFHRVGLSNREAIAAATTNFNEIFGWKIGKIAPGCSADILVLDTNPVDNLEHLKDISLLMLGGRIIDRDNLLR